MSARHAAVAGGALVGAVTFAASSVSLYSLAANCGIPDVWWLPAGLPIALDVGAAVGAIAWITERPGTDARRWGRILALSALALSLAGNGISHAIDMGLLHATLPLVLAVGAVMPAAFFGVFHLAALLVSRQPRPAARPAPKPRVRRERQESPSQPASPEAPAEPAPSEGVSTVEPLNEVAEAAGKRERARAWALEHWPCTGPQIRKATGVSRTEADRARMWAREQIGAAS